MIVCFVVLISGQNVHAQKIKADTVYKPILVKEHSPRKATLIFGFTARFGADL